jgi:hypothetical protein
MGSWQGLISDTEMWEVANFVSRMRDLPPQLEDRWRNPTRPAQ